MQCINFRKFTVAAKIINCFSMHATIGPVAQVTDFNRFSVYVPHRLSDRCQAWHRSERRINCWPTSARRDLSGEEKRPHASRYLIFPSDILIPVEIYIGYVGRLPDFALTFFYFQLSTSCNGPGKAGPVSTIESFQACVPAKQRWLHR